jgi:hypothetical protein
MEDGVRGIVYRDARPGRVRWDAFGSLSALRNRAMYAWVMCMYSISETRMPGHRNE